MKRSTDNLCQSCEIIDVIRSKYAYMVKDPSMINPIFLQDHYGIGKGKQNKEEK